MQSGLNRSHLKLNVCQHLPTPHLAIQKDIKEYQTTVCVIADVQGPQLLEYCSIDPRVPEVSSCGGSAVLQFCHASQLHLKHGKGRRGPHHGHHGASHGASTEGTENDVNKKQQEGNRRTELIA